MQPGIPKRLAFEMAQEARRLRPDGQSAKVLVDEIRQPCHDAVERRDMLLRGLGPHESWA